MLKDEDEKEESREINEESRNRNISSFVTRRSSLLTNKRSLFTVYCLLTALILIFIVAYGYLSVTRHRTFNSTGYDLAIMEQIVWNTAHGRFFASSPEVDNSFADHFRPMLGLLVPIYLLNQSPETLLWIQVVVMALGAVPTFLLARDKLNNIWIALLFAIIYLLTPSLGFIARFDFHVDAFVIPSFLAAVLMIERRNWRWASVWLLIPLLCKENMGASVAAVGLWTIIKDWPLTRKLADRQQMRFGLAWIAIGLVMFVFTSFILIPAVRGETADALGRYAFLGSDTPLVDMWQLFWQDSRPETLLQTFLPTAFLALIALPELVMIAPGLGQNLLADHFCQPTIYCHYTAPVIPFVMVSAIWGLASIYRRFLHGQPGWTHFVLPVLMLLLSVWSLSRDNPFTHDGFLPQWSTPPDNGAVVQQALASVPLTGSLVTTNDYAAQLARRPELYIIGVPAQREAPTDPDILFLNLYDQQYIVCDQIRAYVELLDKDQYGTLFRTGGLIVIARNQGDPNQFIDFVENWNNCAG